MIIRDEIKGIKNTGKVYWFMHTSADSDINIQSDKKTAVLTKGGKSIKLEVITDAQTFEIKEMAAKPLDTSPQTTGQSDNSKYKKIAVVADCTENGNLYIQVKLSPVGSDIMPAENVQLDEWKCDSFTNVICKDEKNVRAEVGAKNLFSIVAIYKGDKLYNVYPANENSYDGMTALCTLPEGEQFSARLYVWTSKEKLCPLTEALAINKKE